MVKKQRKRRPASRRPPGRPPGGPTLVTPEGDPLIFCRALYRHAGMDGGLQILAQAGDFDLDDGPEPGPDGALQFGWYEVGPESHRCLPP